MDDIDKEIERGKIGKKEEKLIGWDHIRRPAETNLPPMKVKKSRQKSAPKGCSSLHCKGPIKEILFTCRRCGKKFCSDHRLPENHNCPFLGKRI